MDQALGAVAQRALADNPEAALADLEAHLGGRQAHGTALAVLAVVHVLNCRFDTAVITKADAADPFGRAVNDFVTAICLAEVPVPVEVVPVEAVPEPLAGLYAFVTVEAAMSAGQITRAEAVARALAAGLESRDRGTFWAWNQVALARSLVFQGRFAEALVEIDRVVQDPRAPSWPAADRIARGVHAFVAAQAGDPAPVDRFVADLDASPGEPRTYLESAAFVLAAFAEQARGRFDRIERLVLRGGGGEFLPRFQIVDRCYAYEMLVEAALSAGDLAGAEGWLDRAEVLAVDGHDMASAALGFIRARVALARNDPAASARELSRSAARAAAVGGQREVSRGRALRDWAVRELGLRGRRLRNVPGLGWESLTEHQQRIALLAAQGLRNRQIAARLSLSERTVEGHISAVLDALGAPSRVGIGQHLPDPVAGPGNALAQLTARQRDVAVLITEGRSNAEIARRLGIAEKTVEKHVRDLFARLGVGSRAGVAAVLRG